MPESQVRASLERIDSIGVAGRWIQCTISLMLDSNLRLVRWGFIVHVIDKLHHSGDTGYTRGSYAIDAKAKPRCLLHNCQGYIP